MTNLITSPIGASSRIITNQADKSVDLYIYDVIGNKEGEVSAKSFATALIAAGPVTKIRLFVNCQGGSVWEATGMYRTLADHPATVEAFVTVAISAATYVLMAADTISMAANGVWMVHDPMGQAGGTVEQLMNAVEQLRQTRENVTNTYAARTKLPPTEVAAIMRAQTWMTAEQAKAKGFIDVITPNKTVTAHVDLSEFSNVPTWCHDTLATLIVKDVSMSGLTPEQQAAADKAAKDAADKAAKDAADKAAKDAADKAAKDAADAAAAAAGGTVTMSRAELQTMMTNTLNASRHRDREIHAMCNRAHVPEMAQAMIDDPKVSISDVAMKLVDVLISKNPPAGGNGGGAGGGADTQQGPEMRFKAEYEANKVTMQNCGVSLDDYVASRKISEGL